MRKLLLLPCLFVSQTLIAQESLWTDISTDYQFRASLQTSATPHSKRKLALNYDKLATQLSNNENSLFEFPLPNGESLMLRTEPSSTLAPKLAAKYPEIKTWRVYDPSNPHVTGNIDMGPNGFHGYVQTADGSRIFIDPDDINDNTTYTALNYRESSQDSDTPFSCQVHDHSLSGKPEMSAIDTTERSLSEVAQPLITYRIAIAATGEYTQLYGGTKAQALAGISTTLSRVNEIYQRDLGILLELVENNDDIIYTSPSTDPYSNEDAVAMVDENVVNINAVIGSDNFDIGHVFGTGSTGGLAFINSACGPYKAGGVTGSSNPQNDAFNVDYVAHEIGHQIGGSHTFNGYQLNCSSGNRESSSAVEPGSGSTIMAYAGICGSDDLQKNSDAFFHSVSIKSIREYTRQGNGATCGTSTAFINNTPYVDAGDDYIIPAGTPFVLTGDTNDIDGDVLSHSWEQIDTGDIGGLHSDLGNNPLFRVWAPTESATRYFPRFSDLMSNQTTIGELLPTTSRSMTFALLTRDNNGSINQDDMRINVIDTGASFAMTSHTSDSALSASQSTLVTWNTAGTNTAPISCSTVDINIVDSLGLSTRLASGVNNDGRQSVTIPADMFSLEDAKLQVACSNNIFFAMSEGNLSILGGSPVLTVNSPTINEGDSGLQNISFILTLSVDAPETIVVNYAITDDATGSVIQRGQTTIIEGESSAIIHAAIAGDTQSEVDQTVTLTIDKPNNAQFVTGDEALVSQGTILDDDVNIISANPDDSTVRTGTIDTGSGGGSFGLFTMLGLSLLIVRRRLIKDAS
ncbi:hypothetical protein EOL70_06285 [Leucothrix sargassi]|nr:hypothetical protein EOL70_06285 [Leucothrix sargassi]